ncbi:MAG: hypothetical protein GPJ52_02840 [Candidatus Heimdallarchaeota archaeon]|nr:hypothetical protein [Candidatus Heimdallarchaeota archaeon]
MSKKTETKTYGKKKVKTLSYNGFPQIFKNRINKLELDTESKKQLKKCVVEKRKSGEISSRDLWMLDGFHKSLKLCLGAKATKIINESKKFKLSPSLAKRIEKYTKLQQTKILKLIQAKIESKEIQKKDLWYGELSKIISEVIDRNEK